MKNAEVVTLVRGTVTEVVSALLKEQDARFDQKMKEQFGFQDLRFDQKLDDLKVNLRDEIHSTEIRMINRLEKRLNEVKVEIIDGVTDILDEFVSPQILELQTDMAEVKNRLHMA